MFEAAQVYAQKRGLSFLLIVYSNPIGESDILIASIALANKQTVITRNKRHFERVPGLQVEGW